MHWVWWGNLRSASSTRPYDPLHCKTGLLCSFRITRGSLTRIWIWFVHFIWYHKCPFHQSQILAEAHFTSDLIQSPSPPLPQGSPGERPKTSQIRSNDRIISKRQKDIESIISYQKTCALLQFVLISWDNQLRFPFWDRTFLLKAKCTAVLQVSHRWLKPIPLSGFWDCFSKTQLCRQCQGHFLYMFSRTVTCLSACSHQFSIMVPVVFEVCFFKRVMFYSCFVHLARLKFVAFLEDFSAWFSFSRCFSLLASWVRHWCKDLDQLRSYAWDLTKKKTRSHTWSVHVIKDIRVSWETAKDRCTVLTFEKF